MIKIGKYYYICNSDILCLLGISMVWWIRAFGIVKKIIHFYEKLKNKYKQTNTKFSGWPHSQNAS